MMRKSAVFGRSTLALAGLLAWTVVACGGSNDFSGVPDDDGGFIDAGLITVDGVRRAYLVSVPEGLENTGAPLIIALHGAFSAGDPFRISSGMDALGDSLGVVMVYPTASEFGNWAEDCGCIAADTAMINDTLFMSLLIDTMAVNFGVNPGNVGVIGFSQGGMFAQRMACQMSDRVGRVAVVAATMSEPLAGRCNPARAVDMFMLLGTADAQFPWDGSDAGLMSTLGAEASMSLWGSLNGCDPDPARDDTSQIEELTWTGCNAGGGSKLLGIRGGGHSFSPGGFSTLGALADFFGS